MHEIAPKKKFGQNFLTDRLIIERIISSAGQLKNKCIVEIGGGSGNLTKYLLEAKPKKLLVIEIDKDYIKILKEILKSKNVEIEEFDIWKDPAKAKEMLQRTNGARTIPQIFIGDQYIGGNDKLQEANRNGDLDKIIKEEWEEIF